MKVVFVVGPTASGKSQTALDLAEKFGGVILNADSVQVYSRLLIGSAAPTEEEKRRVPHFFFQEVEPPQKITAGDYCRRSLEILSELQTKKTKIVFVVGGTGFYLMALEKGMLPIEKASPDIQAKLEARLVKEGESELHQELTRMDPVAGKRISEKDHYRLVRALEVIHRTGRKISDIEEEHKNSPSTFPYPLLKLGVQADRKVLEPRVLKRTKKMLEQGLLKEVESLIEEGFGDWEPLQSVGYKEALAFLQGTGEVSNLQALEDLINQNTLRLAKKQRTWFQRDPDIHWALVENKEVFVTQVQEFLRAP